MSLDESRFAQLAGKEIEDLADLLEEALGDGHDVDLTGGILAIELESGAQFIINQHAPTRQIWLSSPASGASHYAWDEGAKLWVSTRGGTPLRVQLAADLKALAGMTAAL
jgi:frataxin